MKRISVACPVFHGNEKKYLNECIDTGWISSNGRFIQKFEERFAAFCGVKHALACANGTVTLHLSLVAAGIGPGDEVIVPTLTYIATANTVRYCGATPVFADSDAATWNISTADIEKRITTKTKAIMPVHLYGLPADMEPILQIADKYGLMVIEDAAEAHGAEYHGMRTGSIGHVGSFSFFGNKIITCGEGGMITTNDCTLYKKMKLLRSQGVDPEKRYWHSVIGYNYRMTNMQAAVGLGQLEDIDWHLEQRQRVASLYRKHFSKIQDYVDVQFVPDDTAHVYWMNSIILKDCVTISRDETIEKMDERGIELRPLFYPVHTMPSYFDEGVIAPNAERLSSRGMNLPSHACLTEEDICYTVDNIAQLIGM